MSAPTVDQSKRRTWRAARAPAARPAAPGRRAAVRPRRPARPRPRWRTARPPRPGPGPGRTRPGREASTGAPADIASTRMMPKLSPPVLGATYRSTLRSSRALSSSLTMPRNSTRERISGGQRLDGLLLVAAARDQQPGVRAAPARIFGQRLHQHRQALAGLVDAADEADRAALPLGLGLGRGEEADVDAVRDDDRVAAEVLDQRAAGVLAHRDPRADLLQRGLQDRIRGDHRPRARVGGVEGGHDRALRRPAGQQRRARARPARGCGSRRTSPSCSQRRTRAADRKPKFSRATEPLYGTGTARPAETTYGGSGVSSSAGARTDTSWPSADQVLGQVPDVELDAARHVPGVRADDADPHAARPGPPGVLRPGRLRAVQVGEPQPLQHVPVLRVLGDARGEGVGQRLCHDGRLLGPGTCLGDLDRRVDPAPHAPACRRTRASPAAAARRSAGRAAPARRASGRVSPKNFTSTPEADRSRSATRQTRPPARSRRARVPKAVPPRVRQHLHAQALAVGDEAVVQRLRLEAFGDGREGRLQARW